MQTAQQLQQENVFLKEKVSSLEEQIDYYKNAFLQLHKKQFSPSSEKISVDQLGLFNEAEAIKQETSEKETVTVAVTLSPKETPCQHSCRPTS